MLSGILFIDIKEAFDYVSKTELVGKILDPDINENLIK